MATVRARQGPRHDEGQGATQRPVRGATRRCPWRGVQARLAGAGPQPGARTAAANRGGRSEPMAGTTVAGVSSGARTPGADSRSEPWGAAASRGRALSARGPRADTGAAGERSGGRGVVGRVDAGRGRPRAGTGAAGGRCGGEAKDEGGRGRHEQGRARTGATAAFVGRQARVAWPVGNFKRLCRVPVIRHSAKIFFIFLIPLPSATRSHARQSFFFENLFFAECSRIRRSAHFKNFIFLFCFYFLKNIFKILFFCFEKLFFYFF